MKSGIVTDRMSAALAASVLINSGMFVKVDTETADEFQPDLSVKTTNKVPVEPVAEPPTRQQRRAAERAANKNQRRYRIDK